MSEDQFAKLFKYMQQEFGAVRTEIQSVRADIGRVYTILDAQASRLETIELEQAATNNHLERLDRRVGAVESAQAATNTKLDRLDNDISTAGTKLDTLDDKLTAHTEVQRRHGRWISQLAESTNTKLVPEP